MGLNNGYYPFDDGVLKNSPVDYFSERASLPRWKPNRNYSSPRYRYGFQGQGKDPETGKEAFELRFWDGRIGRWLTTDPKGQYHSPYLGMGNNPISSIDPDGGSNCGGAGQPPCPDGGWEMDLDPVVINASIGGASMNARGFDPSFPTWTSSFNGSLSDWNLKRGTNFKDHYKAYDYWLKLTKQNELNSFMADFTKKRNEMGVAVAKIIGVGIAPVFVVETVPLLTPYFSTSVASEGLVSRVGFETFSEILSKKGNLGNVNILGIGASVFGSKIGNEIVSSKFSFTFNSGFRVNSTSETVINFTVGKINGGIHSNLAKFSNALGNGGTVQAYRIIFTGAGQTGTKYFSNEIQNR